MDGARGVLLNCCDPGITSTPFHQHLHYWSWNLPLAHSQASLSVAYATFKSFKLNVASHQH
jgi:hypothetical protein